MHKYFKNPPEHFFSHYILIIQKGIYIFLVIWAQFILRNELGFLFKESTHCSLNWLTTFSNWSINQAIPQADYFSEKNTGLGINRLSQAHIIHENPHKTGSHRAEESDQNHMAQ